MKNTNLAQWVIDNRYAKSEKEKVSDAEMYHKILEHTAQLQADKAELLEALEKVRDYHYNSYFIDSEFNEEIESLIQKHKQ